MGEDTDRRAELIGAALAGELTPQERAELDELARQDPSVQEELTELRELLGRVEVADRGWSDAAPADGLADRVAALADDPGATDRTGPTEPSGLASTGPSWRARAGRGLVAACLVGVGVLGTIGYQSTVQGPPDGPPGTLGAVEEISFTGEPGDSQVDAALVAHTWGTETVLEVDGLEIGETYEVVLVTSSGEELPSGTFIGAEATVECRMNAAVMREDVAQVRIVSSDGTSVRLVAELPDAGT